MKAQQPKNAARNRRGFTLVEMLAASALMALLAVTVLRSVTGLAGSKKQPQMFSDTTAVRRIIQWDLANTTGVQPSDTGVMLDSQGALSGNTRSPTHRPVRVSYRIVPVGGIRWLVREQASTDPTEAVSSELVCAGVRAFSIQPHNRDGYRVRMTWTDPSRLPLDELIVAR